MKRATMLSPHKLAPLAAMACALAVPATAAASDYNAAVLSAAPTLYWQLDEAGGTTADNAATADGSGDGVASDASALGAAGAFPSSPQAATVEGESAIATAVQGRALAVEFWVKPAARGSGPFLTYGDAVELGYNAKGKLTLSVAGGPAKDTRVGLPLDRWTLVDVSLNTGSGDDAQVFTNGGTWRVKTVRNAGVAPEAPVGAVTLGGGIGGIDELATFPNPVTQAQAYAHYATTALPLSTAPPTVSGTPQSGQTLTATPATWSNATTTGFQWQRCDSDDPTASACDEIAGATGATYLVQDADVGSYLSVTETSANANGVGAIDSVAVGAVTPAPIVDPGTGGDTGDTGGGTTDTGAPGSESTGTGATSGGTDPGTTAGTTPGSGVACAVRLARVPKARSARVRGIGRVKLLVKRGKAPARLRVVVKAKKAKVRRVAFKLDRKVLKGKKRVLTRKPSLKKVKAGRHVLRAKITPKRGNARTLKIALKVKAC